MKVKQLIQKLSKLDPKLEVIMSSDGEGNNFSPFHDLYVSEVDDDFNPIDPEEEEPRFKGKEAVILFPA